MIPTKGSTGEPYHSHSRTLASTAVGVLLISVLSTATAAGDTHVESEALVWPAITDEGVDASKMADLAIAFGAEADEVVRLESLYQALASEEAGVATLALQELTLGEAVEPRWTGSNAYVHIGVGRSDGGALTITILETGSYFEGAEVVDVGGVRIDISDVFEPPSASVHVRQSMYEGLTAAGAPVQPFANTISGCTALPNSGGWVRRTNCRLYSNGGAASATMFFDYSVRSGGGRIDGTPYSGGRQCVLGAVTNPSVSVIRRLNSGTTPAQARQSFDCLYAGHITTHAWHAAFAYGSVWGEHN